MAAGLSDLRPFFSYFGGKWTLAPRYPTPQHDTIIEPFAGSAGYATRYANRRVILIERFAAVASMWKWLTRASVREIQALPVDIDALDNLIPEARCLIGFWLARGRTRPATSGSSKWLREGRWPSSFWGPYARERIARQVTQIRHWRVLEGDYTSAPNCRATWFVDPPYVRSNHYAARVDDYADLGDWCRMRKGLTMVCEQQGADWLPFEPFRRAKSIARGAYNKVVFVRDDKA